jgi:hypothetical protein
MAEGLLQGFGAAIPAAIQGFQNQKAFDLKQKETQAKIDAQAENKKWQKIQRELAAKKLGYDISETPEGEYELIQQEQAPGFLSKEDELYMKGFVRDPETGALQPSDWKAQQLAKNDVSGLLKQYQLRDVMRQEQQAQKGKPLDRNTIKMLSEGKAIPNTLSTIEKTIEDNTNLFDPIKGTARSFNPYDKDAKIIDAQLRAAAQQFGRYMEGGVLRKEDEEKYRRMMPQLGDTPAVAKGKLKVVKEMLDRQQKQYVQDYKSQGFDLEGFDSGLGVIEPQGVQSAPQGLINQQVAQPMATPEVDMDEMTQAEQWARANPNDPRSAEILRRLGK